jgi:hypothetical protein
VNKEMLTKLKNTWIRISPGLYQAARGRSLDLQFFVEGASKEGLLLRETGSTMQLQVPADHIHAYFNDFDQRDGQRHGVLSLNAQYTQDIEWGPIRFDPIRNSSDRATISA